MFDAWNEGALQQCPPPANRWTDRSQNHATEQLVRVLVYKGYNWVEFLMLIELALNNTVAESTSTSPAHVTYGHFLPMPIDHLHSMHSVQVAQDQIQKWEEIKDTVRRKLLQAYAY